MASEVGHNLVGAGFAAAEGLEGELEPASSGAVSAAIGRNDSSASTEARGSTAVPPRPPPHVPPLTAKALGPSDGGCGGGVAAAAATAAVRAPSSGDECEQNHEGEGRRDSGLCVQDVKLVSRAAAGIAARIDAQAGSGEDERMEEEGGDSESTVSTVEKKKKRRKKKKKSKKSKGTKVKDPSSAAASEQPVLVTTKADPAVTPESISATVADCAESVAAVEEQRGPLSCLEAGQALNTRACRQDGTPGKEMGANDDASGFSQRAYQLSKGVAGLAARVDGSIARNDHVGRGSAGEDVMLDRQVHGPDAEPFKAGVERRGVAGTEPSAGPTIVEAATSADGEGIEGYGAAGLEAVRVRGSIGGARVSVAKRAVIAVDSSAALGAATEPVPAEASGAPVGGGDVYTTDSVIAEDGGGRGAGERGAGETPETAPEARAGLQPLGTAVTRRVAVTRPTFAPPSLGGEGAEGDQTEKGGRDAGDGPSGDGPSEVGGEAWESAVAPMQSFGVTETNTATGWALATSSVGRAATGGDQVGPGRAAKISSVVRKMSAAAAARVGTTDTREMRGTVLRPSLAAPSVGSETETTEGDQTEGEGTAERGSDDGGVTAREPAVGAAVAEARPFALKHARGTVRWPSLGAPSTGSETTEGDQAEVKAAEEEEAGAEAGGGVAFAPVTTGVGSLGTKDALASRRQEQRAAAAALSTLDAPKVMPASEEDKYITSGKSGAGEIECPVMVAPDVTNERGIVEVAEKLAGDKCRGLMSDDTSAAVTTSPLKNPETNEIEDAVAGLAGDVTVVEPVLVEVAAETAAATGKLNPGVGITKPVVIEGRGAKDSGEDVEATTPVALAIECSLPDSGKVLVDVDGAAWDGVAGHIVESTAAALTPRSDVSSTAVITYLQTDQDNGGQRDVVVAPPAATPGVVGKLLRSSEKIAVAERRDEPTADELTTNAADSAAAAATEPIVAVAPEVVMTAGIVSAGTEVETTADLDAVVEPAAESADSTLGRAEHHGGVSVEASPAVLGEEDTGVCEAQAGSELTVADASVEPVAVELSAPTLGQQVDPKANPNAMRGSVVRAVVAATAESSAPSELLAGRRTASKLGTEADETRKAEESVAHTSSALDATEPAAMPVDALPREYVKDLGQTATAVVTTTTTTTTTDIHSFTAIDRGMEEAKVVDIFVSLGGGGSSGGAWPGSRDAENSPGISVEEAAAFMGSVLNRRFSSGSSWATTATSMIADVDRAGMSIPAGSPTPAGAISAAPLMSPSLAAAAATMFSGTGDFMSPTNYPRSFGDGSRRHSSDASGSALVVPASGEAPPGPHDVFLSTTTALVGGADGRIIRSSRSTAAGMAVAAGVVSTAVGGDIVSATVGGGVVDDGEGRGGIEGDRESLAKVVRQSDALPGVDGGAAVASGSGRRSSLSGDYSGGSDEANSAHDAPASAGEGVRGEQREEDGRLDESANGSSVVSTSAAAAPTGPITSAVSGVVVEEFSGDSCGQEGRGGGGGGGGDGDAASAAAVSTKPAAGSAATSIVGNTGGEVEIGSFVGDDHGGRHVSGGRGASGGGGCCVVA